MPTTVKATLRDRTLTGTVTTADLIPISQLLMNPDERAVMFNPETPDPILASELLQARLREQVDRLTAEFGGDEAAANRANDVIMSEWMKRLMVICESDLALRTLILTRLLEIFPDIPREWISYDPVTQLAGHRLEADELLLDLILVIYIAIAQDDNGALQTRSEKRDARSAAMKQLIGLSAAAGAAAATTAKVEPTPATLASPPPVEPAIAAEPQPAPMPIDLTSLSPTQRMELLKALREPEGQPTGLLEELSLK